MVVKKVLKLGVRVLVKCRVGTQYYWVTIVLLTKQIHTVIEFFFAFHE